MFSCAELFSVMYPGAYDAAEQASTYGSHFTQISLEALGSFLQCTKRDRTPMLRSISGETRLWAHTM